MVGTRPATPSERRYRRASGRIPQLSLVLGPAAIVLALTALSRGTRRRGRAVLGLALGVAGLVIQVAVAVAGHGVLWSFG